jgi:hypothetical protein
MQAGRTLVGAAAGLAQVAVTGLVSSSEEGAIGGELVSARLASEVA